MDEQDLFDLTFDNITRSLTDTVQHKDWLASWQERLRTLQADRRTYKGHVAAVVQSDEYTPKGRERRMSELHAALRERLQAEAATLQGYQNHLAQLQQTTKPQARDSEISEILRYLRGQELRAEIRKLDPLTLRGDYEAKTHDSSGDSDAWLQAVEESPIPLLPGEVLDRGKASRRLRALDPKVRQEVNDLTQLAESYKHLVGLVERELPANDPIAERAMRTESAE